MRDTESAVFTILSELDRADVKRRRRALHSQAPRLVYQLCQLVTTGRVLPVMPLAGIYIREGGRKMARMGNPGLKKVDASPRPRLRVGSSVSQCPTCALFFTGVKPFDRHLLGSGSANPRCMTETEMRAIGMKQNAYGTWQYGQAKKDVECSKEQKE
jgi:hypothetical protein